MKRIPGTILAECDICHNISPDTWLNTCQICDCTICLTCMNMKRFVCPICKSKNFKKAY